MTAAKPNILDLYGWEQEPVLISDINTRPPYQRNLSMAWIRAKAKAFDWRRFGIIEISIREDGSTWAIDGQHRIELLKHLGLAEQEIAAAVYRNLAMKDEAAIFLARNEGRPVHPFDRMQADLIAETPDAVAISRCVESLGLRLTRERVRGGIAAAQALRRVYSGDVLKMKRTMPGTLKDTLLALRDAWLDEDVPKGGKALTFHPQAIESVGAFLCRYAQKVDLNRLIKQMRDYPGGSQRFVMNAKGIKLIRGGLLRDAAAEILVEMYNKGLRSGGSQLPPWAR